MFNFIHILNNFLDRKPTLAFFLVTFLVMNACFLVVYQEFVTLIPGISIFGLIIIFFLFKNGLIKVKFDKSKYIIPTENEEIVVRKGFMTEGKMSMFGFTTKGGYWFKKGEVWKIKKVIELDTEWRLMIKDEERNIVLNIRYLETRKFWATKADLRNEILEKIGI